MQRQTPRFLVRIGVFCLLVSTFRILKLKRYWGEIPDESAVEAAPV
jgi:hypothetical protein